jgi:hypothetical protein
MTREPFVRAVMWWCEDPVCDCTQPIIERVTPPPLSGHMGYKFERLWEGTFCSRDTEQDDAKQWAELRAAAARFGVPMPEDAPSDTEAGR